MNHEEAIKTYCRNAKNGNARSLNNLGYCFQYGLGVERNEEAAFAIYAVAAEYGDGNPAPP